MIFLTSSIASVAGHLYEHFLKDERFTSVLFVDTAAEPKMLGNLEWLEKDLQSLRNVGYQVDRYSVAGKTRDETEHQIDSHDIFYMCGGHTAHLLQTLRTTNTFELIKEKIHHGKPYIGTSAGSIIAGPKLPDYFYEDVQGLNDLSCLGFVNFTIVPHWGDPHFKERYINDRLGTAYKETQVPLLLLTDQQYVRVEEGGAVEIITVR